MKRTTGYLTVMASLTVVFPALAGSAVILSDDFDGENGGTAVTNYAGFSQWTVSDGTVDLIGPGLADVYPGNGLYVDLDGTTGNAGVLSSTDTFALEPGMYQLQFDLGDVSYSLMTGAPNDMQVALGSVYLETFVTDDAMIDEFVTITRTISVPEPVNVQLVFSHSGGDNHGMVIDNIALSRVGAAVPASSAWGLVLFILVIACTACLAFDMRSRRQDSQHQDSQRVD